MSYGGGGYGSRGGGGGGGYSNGYDTSNGGYGAYNFDYNNHYASAYGYDHIPDGLGISGVVFGSPIHPAISFLIKVLRAD